MVFLIISTLILQPKPKKHTENIVHPAVGLGVSI